MLLQITIQNTFFVRDVVKLTMLHNPYKGMLGYYTKLCKAMKETAADIERIDKHFIKLKIEKVVGNSKRIIMEFDSGAVVDMPNDMSEEDFQILFHHLEIRKLQLKK